MEPIIHQARCADRAHVRIPNPDAAPSLVERVSCQGGRVLHVATNVWRVGTDLWVTVQPHKNNETGHVELTVHRRELDEDDEDDDEDEDDEDEDDEDDDEDEDDEDDDEDEDDEDDDEDEDA